MAEASCDVLLAGFDRPKLAEQDCTGQGETIILRPRRPLTHIARIYNAAAEVTRTVTLRNDKYLGFAQVARRVEPCRSQDICTSRPVQSS